MPDPTSSQPETHTADDLRSLLQDAEHALSSGVGEAGDKFETLRARLRAALENSKVSLERLRAEAALRAKQADQLVRDNPYYAIGIAAGVGALIGILVSRSCNSPR